MKDLIAKLEAAETGSRNLDAGIAVCVNWKERGVPIREFLQKHPDANVFHWGFPHYTTSIDAALTLAGDRQIIELIIEHNKETQIETLGWTILAATPALALCIAALKARDES